MAMASSSSITPPPPSPRRWTRLDLPTTSGPKATDAGGADVKGRSAHQHHEPRHLAFYGPGELEVYRHARLRRAVDEAKLKVWYPGKWRLHSHRARLRARLSGDHLIESQGNQIDALEFRSNARIVSAELAQGRECEESSEGQIDRRDRCRVRWDSSARTVRDERVYDHALMLDHIGSAGSRLEECSWIVLEMDTCLPLDSEDSQTALNDMSDSRNHDGGVDANERLDLEKATHHPPPCVVLHQQHWTRDWEWKVNEGDEWMPISSCWKLPLESKQPRTSCQGVPGAKRTSCVDKQPEELWTFPHQMDLHQVTVVHPTEQLARSGSAGDAAAHGNAQNGIVFDFGRELLGHVHVSMPASASTGPPLTPKLRVGETLEEAMNDEEDHFEQCVDLSYLLDHESATKNLDDSGIETAEDRSQPTSGGPKHVWISCLLAFRYVRVIASCDEESDIAIACHAHWPLLEQRGSFSCSSGSSSDPAPTVHEQQQPVELDERIWNCAAETLRHCIYDNFIVDGIKRDRLPWAGDLAVSLMANAYSFRDADCVRWTLMVLGRCGADKLDPEKALKSGLPGSHINGCVDYSFWFIVSHWLYQLYFGDEVFLRQEWWLIELRLRYLLKCCDDGGRFAANDDDWIFIDWTVDGDKSMALQILWWWALDCGKYLAKKNGSQKQDKADIISLLISASATLENTLLEMKDIQCGYSRHAHILGLLSGLFTRLDDRAREGEWFNPDSSDERWQCLRRCRQLHTRSVEALLNDELTPVATPYMKHLECLALCRLGERSSALRRIRSYWGRMLDCNATTFFEAFDENETLANVSRFYDRPYARSLCHAWASGPCALYPEILFGLKPSCDGWKEWICDLCDPLALEWVGSASVETNFGVIHMRLNPDHLTVLVPNDTTMVLMDTHYGGGRYCFPRQSLVSSHIVRKWSMKYRGWKHHPTHVIKPNPTIPGFEEIQMTDVPTIFQLSGSDLYFMSFVGFDGSGYQSFLAESHNLLEWTNIRLAMGYGEEGSFDHGGVVLGAYLLNDYEIKAKRTLKQVDGKYISLYGAYAKKGSYEPDPGSQGLASSEDGLVWKREYEECMLSIHGPGIVKEWEKDSIYQPWVVENGGLYYNYYNAKQLPQWIEQIGLATSDDLRNFERFKDNPILRVSKRINSALNDGFDTQFASDAKVFYDSEESHWVMFYFGVGKGKSGKRIMMHPSDPRH
ncbi:hypothetical protein ACHAWF_010986 [Thalassiosira exigua]